MMGRKLTRVMQDANGVTNLIILTRGISSQYISKMALSKSSDNV